MEGDVRSPKRLRVTEDEFENYDVFISHRGPDTKTGFASFLYKGLEAAGLRPFLDCGSIIMGQDHRACIDLAIKATPIAVVILSKNFAKSGRCLRELHIMLDTPGVKVLPVFYNVQPHEVCFPEGQFAAGFEKLKRRHDVTVVEQWRKDLRRVSELRGWEHEADQRLEGDLVKEIVGEVFELVNKELPLDVGGYVIGVDRVAQEIIQKLDDNKTVLMLGLRGMSGIGKSTLARELYNQMRRRFAASCYVEDVSEKVVQAGLVKLQNRILKDLYKDDSGEIEDKSRGKVSLEERLCNKKILLVLDDVRDNDEMEYLISRKMLAEGSMCMVTSRNRRVFEISSSFDMNHEVHIHDVQGLSSVDSKRVFASCVFGGVSKVKQGFEELVANISEACGGVPLALKVCGDLLKDEEDVDMWEEVLQKLSCGTAMDENVNRGTTMDENENMIFECLRIRYDALQQEHQEMFLDIGCALLGQSKDLAIRFWKSCGWSATLGLRSLEEKGLVTIDGQGRLSMHGHLRDMGREIVRKKRTREGVKRLWMPESLTLLKENELLPESVQTLTVFSNDEYGIDGSRILLDVSHLKDLRILICGYNINVTKSLPKNLSWSNSVNIFPKVPRFNKLVILSLIGSHTETLCESIGDLSNLEVLDLSFTRSLSLLPQSFGRLRNLKDVQLQGSGIQSLPESFGELNNLKVLDLSYCKSLVMLPNTFGGFRKSRNLKSRIQGLPGSFGELTNLEVLNISHCEKLSLLPQSFGLLRNLRNVQLQGSGIQSLPESFGELNNLETLDLSYCEELILLPASFGRLRKLKDVQVQGSGIQSLPESFGALDNLETLDLSYCEELISLPESFGCLRKLKDVQVQGSGIQSLPESFGALDNLETLDLSYCEELISLPESFGLLRNLKDVQLQGSGVQSLPESFGELSNLETLDLSYCEELISLPESFGCLRKLKDVQVQGSGIQSLPESFGELNNLETLDLSYCEELILLPASFGCLRKLKDVQVQGSGIQSLPESFGGLDNLETLDLSYCEELISLPESFGCLRKLKDVQVQGSGIQSLPESFGGLDNLETLDLSYCEELISLPESFGCLRKLKDVQVQGSGIQSLPESFGALDNLETLDLSCCEELILLPESFGCLRKLKDVQVQGSGVQSLPKSFGELSNLQMLDLSCCEKLMSLPQSFGGLRNLKDVQLQGSGVQSLPKSFGDLSNLEILDLSFCGKLISLPQSFGRLRKLSAVQLQGSGVQSLPKSFGELINLETLDLSCCEKLMSLPESFGGLRKLKDVQVQGSGIQSLPESFGGLDNLETLDLSYCEELISLPESFGCLRKLKDVQVQGSGIQSLPESFGALDNLETLDLSCCEELILLPESFGCLRKLKDVQVQGSGVQSLPKSFGELSNLQMLDLSCCEKLMSLPQSFGGLRNLKDVQLQGSGVQSLPKSFGDLSNLEILDLSFCGKLISLPQSFGRLRKLSAVQLQGSGVQSLPKSFGELINLQMLDLRQCENLILLPNPLTSLRNMRDLHLDDLHNLCDFCDCISFEAAGFHESGFKNGNLFGELRPIQEVVQKSKKCILCRKVTEYLGERNSGKFDVQALDLQSEESCARYEMVQLHSVEVGAEGEPKGRLVRLQVTLNILSPEGAAHSLSIEFQKCSQYLQQPTVKDSYPGGSPTDWGIEQQQAYSGRIRPSLADTRLFCKWIETCCAMHLHPHCGKNIYDDEEERLTFMGLDGLRLIDVENMCVVHGKGNMNYTALSYIWGRMSIPEQAKLTTLNTFGERKSLESDKLPKTIGDAIEVTKSLGFQYIWIDCLCILQDDEDDKRYFIPRMDKIFGCALVTIVAASGDNADAGLAGVRPNTRTPEQVSFMVKGVSLVRTLDPERRDSSFDGYLKDSEWCKRAWTFQEKLLSGRALIFTEEQVYWECQKATWCEDGFWETTTSPVIYRHCFGDKDYCHPWDGSFERRYRKMVEEYSGRMLTYERDRRDAFEGILYCSVSEAREHFLWALPKWLLSNALTWHFVERSPKRNQESCLVTSILDYRIRACRFPSWSWLGWVGKVGFNNHGRLDAETVDLDFYCFIGRKLRRVNQWGATQSLCDMCIRRYDDKTIVHPKDIPVSVLDSIVEESFQSNILFFWSSSAKLLVRLGLDKDGLDELFLSHDGKVVPARFWLHTPDRELLKPGGEVQVEFVVIGKFVHFWKEGVATRDDTEWDENYLAVLLVSGEDGVAYRRGLVYVDLSDWVNLDNREWKLICLG